MPERPNIIFIMPDQLRYDFMSCYDVAHISTPNIDSLADQGVLYTQAYSQHPVCVPARISLITGMHAIKTGVLDNGLTLRPDYNACGIQTWPELLDDHGYYTVATGKMHFYPWEKRLGFRHRIIAEDKLWGYIEDDYYHFLAANGLSKRAFADDPSYHENDMTLVSPLPWEYTVDHFVGQETARWIREYDGDAPFAMMVGFPGPHSPYDPAPEYADADPGEMPEPVSPVSDDVAMMRSKKPSRSTSARKSWYAPRGGRQRDRDLYLLQRAHYQGLVRQIDYEVGCILEALRETGRYENTVILFSTDHGDYLGDHGLTGKASYYDAACHIPMVVRNPMATEGSQSSALVTLTDVTATILSLAGVTVPDYMDALPLPGLGLEDEGSRDWIMGALRNGWMAFDGRWKLNKYPGGAHLFDLARDPQEMNNLAGDADSAAERQRLDTMLTAETMRLMDEAFWPRRVYTYSHSSNPEFGRVGWERTYPMPWDQIYGD